MLHYFSYRFLFVLINSIVANRSQGKSKKIFGLGHFSVRNPAFLSLSLTDQTCKKGRADMYKVKNNVIQVYNIFSSIEKLWILVPKIAYTLCYVRACKYIYIFV